MRAKILNTTKALTKGINNKKLFVAFYKSQGAPI